MSPLWEKHEHIILDDSGELRDGAKRRLDEALTGKKMTLRTTGNGKPTLAGGLSPLFNEMS